jgi:hypothetical protein
MRRGGASPLLRKSDSFFAKKFRPISRGALGPINLGVCGVGVKKEMFFFVKSEA